MPPLLTRYSSRAPVPGAVGQSVERAPTVAQTGVAEAQALQGVAQAVGDVSSLLIGLEKKRQDREDKLIVNKALTEYRAGLREQGIVFNQQKGENAIGLYSTANVWVDDYNSKFSDIRGFSQNQREMFDLSTPTYNETFLDSVSNHQAREALALEKQNLDAAYVQTDLDVRSLAGNLNFEESFGQTEASIEAQVDMIDETYPGQNNKKQKEVTRESLWLSSYQELAVLKPERAIAERERYIGKIDAEDIETIVNGAIGKNKQQKKQLNRAGAQTFTNEKFNQDFKTGIYGPAIEFYNDPENYQTLGLEADDAAWMQEWLTGQRNEYRKQWDLAGEAEEQGIVDLLGLENYNEAERLWTDSIHIAPGTRRILLNSIKTGRRGLIKNNPETERDLAVLIDSGDITNKAIIYSAVGPEGIDMPAVGRLLNRLKEVQKAVSGANYVKLSEARFNELYPKSLGSKRRTDLFMATLTQIMDKNNLTPNDPEVLEWSEKLLEKVNFEGKYRDKALYFAFEDMPWIDDPGFRAGVAANIANARADDIGALEAVRQLTIPEIE